MFINLVKACSAIVAGSPERNSEILVVIFIEIGPDCVRSTVSRDICNRPDARQDRNDFRRFLRSHVRSGRHRFGILRMARGQNKHLVHFQCQRISASSRCRGRISARHEEKAIKTKDEDLPDVIMWFGVRDYHLARKFCFHDISNSSLRKYTIPFGFLCHTALTLSAQDNLCQFHRMWQAPYCQCQAPRQSGRIYGMERLSRSGFRLNTRCVRETAQHLGRQVCGPLSMKCRRLPCLS